MGGQKIPADVKDLFKSSRAASGGLAGQVRQQHEGYSGALPVH